MPQWQFYCLVAKSWNFKISLTDLWISKTDNERACARSAHVREFRKKNKFLNFLSFLYEIYRKFAKIITLYFFLFSEKWSIENSDSSSCRISSKRTKYIMVVRVYHHLGLMTSYVCFFRENGTYLYDFGPTSKRLWNLNIFQHFHCWNKYHVFLGE